MANRSSTVSLKRRENLAIKLLIGLVVVIVFLGVLLAAFSPPTRHERTDPADAVFRCWLIFLTAALLARYPVVAIHEFGHYVAGRLAKMTLHYFQIGPIGFFVSTHGTKVRRVGSWFGANGVCGMLPTKGVFRPASAAVFILGGPVASVTLLI